MNVLVVGAPICVPMNQRRIAITEKAAVIVVLRLQSLDSLVRDFRESNDRNVLIPISPADFVYF